MKLSHTWSQYEASPLLVQPGYKLYVTVTDSSTNSGDDLTHTLEASDRAKPRFVKSYVRTGVDDPGEAVILISQRAKN